MTRALAITAGILTGALSSALLAWSGKDLLIKARVQLLITQTRASHDDHRRVS